MYVKSTYDKTYLVKPAYIVFEMGVDNYRNYESEKMLNVG